MAVIEVQNLQKRYGDTVAVRDVSFAVDRGEIFGILGPNGAGKTTTAECIAGLRSPDNGTVDVLGRAPRDRELRKLVGVQLQESQLPDKLTVREALELYSAFYPDAGTGELLSAVTSLLASQQITAAELRIEQANLDDAFVHLTTRTGKE